MISALFYLQFHSARNRLRARLQRLKNPKYLIGGIIGGLYMVFYFWSLVFAPRPADHVSLLSSDPLLAENFGALLLFLAVLLLGWVLPNERAALIFSEAEINFLFPAPVTRRQLIQYKLVRAQAGILFSLFFLTLIWGRWRYGGQVWISALGWWVILSTLNLHTIAASFGRTMLLDRGITNWRRRIFILVPLLVIIGAACFWSERQWPPFPAEASFGEAVRWFEQVLSTGATPYVLYPFRLVVRPYFAPDATAFLIALLPALAILAAHYVIVIRANVAFEEASIEASQKLIAKVTNLREQRAGGRVGPTKARPSPFPLAPTGLPSIAFLWKNLILSGSALTRRVFWYFMLVVFVIGVFVHASHAFDTLLLVASVFCVAFLFLSVFFGQLLFRFDFRSDLNMAEQLLSYPLPGWQVVLGEILAPVVVLATTQWLLILGALLLAPAGTAKFDLPLGLRLLLAFAAALVFPAVDAVLLLIPNAAAVLFPSWVRFDKNAPRGIENFGQTIILLVGQLAVMFAVLLPAVLGFFITVYSLGFLLPYSFAFLLAAMVATAILIGETYFSIRLLGKAFERFDLSSETTN